MLRDTGCTLLLLLLLLRSLLLPSVRALHTPLCLLPVWQGCAMLKYLSHSNTDPSYNNNNKRPFTPKSMAPTGDEHAKLKT